MELLQLLCWTFSTFLWGIMEVKRCYHLVIPYIYLILDNNTPLKIGTNYVVITV